MSNKMSEKIAKDVDLETVKGMCDCEEECEVPAEEVKEDPEVQKLQDHPLDFALVMGLIGAASRGDDFDVAAMRDLVLEHLRILRLFQVHCMENLEEEEGVDQE